jgi:Uncharacterized conserved protein (COG2071)
MAQKLRDTSYAAPVDRRDRALENVLVYSFLAHAAAMASMAALLLPVMPGGGAPDAERIRRIAEHPWIFRLGWLPWHVTALVDLVFAVALLRARWIPRLPAAIALLLTVCAVVPDQGGQLLWITRGVKLAEGAVQTSDLGPYLAFEGPVFRAVAGWGGSFYTLGALAWTACFVRTEIWSRKLTWLSVVTWACFIVVSPAPILPPSFRPPAGAVAAGNAIGFVLLLIWTAAVTEAVLRRTRPDTPPHTGVHAPWRHPSASVSGRAMELLANSRFMRSLCSLSPVPSFASDITDVVYANYLVPAERLLPLVPKGLSLQRLGPGGRHALFTFLTYRHGHFGPRMLGPLRRLFPSPVHSNWRIHVEDPRTGKKGIFFVTNAIASTVQALGARLMSEGMPMHVLSRGEIARGGDGAIRLVIDPGGGTAPDADIALRPAAAAPELQAPWSECFASYREFLGYCVPQDRAMATQPWQGTVSRQEIDLGIPLDACEPLEGEVRSRAAEAIAGEARPLCFRVAGVRFLFTGEELDRLPQSPDR